MAASDRIDELKKRYDENPRRFFASLANEYRKAGDLETAISLCQMHLAEQPGNMNGHVVYGQALFEAGRYDEARVTFEAALNLDPENLIALRHLGDIACTNGENEQAREWYVRVLDADPRNDEIIALLAHLEAELKKPAIGTPVAPMPVVAPDEASAHVESSASADSRVSREARTQEFTPPRITTPVSSRAVSQTPVSSPTPIVPIESVNTTRTPAVSTPAVPPPAARPSMGLMDLSIEFDSTPTMPPPSAPAQPAAANAADEFPEFEEITLGTPLGSSSPAPEAAADMTADAFVEVSPLELQAWEPPVVESPRAAKRTPVVEPVPFVEAQPVAEAAAIDETSAHVEAISEPEPEPVPIAELAPDVPEPEPTAPIAFASQAADTADTLFGDSLPAEPEAPFVTETMAELYLQQGFTVEAIEVYRQLSARSPHDEKLAQRLRQLEQGDATSVSSGASSAAEDYAAEGAVPLGGMMDLDMTPVVSRTPIREQTPVVPMAHVAEAIAGTGDSHITARSFFAGLSARRAVQGSGRARVAPRSATPSLATPLIPEQVVGAPVFAAPIDYTASTVSIDQLFSGGAISPEDEHLALAFAQVAGAVEMHGTSVKGKPTAPAATELSLDSVFREADSKVSGTVARQSQTLRFDQFFSATPESQAPAEPTQGSAPAGDPGSPAEIEQFQSWLGGLKKP